MGNIISPKELKDIEPISIDIHRNVNNYQLIIFDDDHNYANISEMVISVMFSNEQSYRNAQHIIFDNKKPLIVDFGSNLLSCDVMRISELRNNNDGTYEITFRGLYVSVNEYKLLRIENKQIVVKYNIYDKIKNLSDKPINDMSLKEFNERRMAIEI